MVAGYETMDLKIRAGANAPRKAGRAFQRFMVQQGVVCQSYCRRNRILNEGVIGPVRGVPPITLRLVLNLVPRYRGPVIESVERGGSWLTVISVTEKPGEACKSHKPSVLTDMDRET